jgi:CII-binding regulator of phage lambda lysogenization HflD
MSDIYLTQKVSPNTVKATYQKYLFIIFAIFGFIFIWLTKLLGFPQIFVTLTVVSLIPIYCFTTYKNTSFGLREDQIGDNAYYLGFLYTLSSLSFALWKFSSQNIGTEIVSSFGVALWSTICGVALRVFFSQMYQDPNEIEAGARARIAQTADQLVTELNQASNAFNTYSRNLRQAVEEAFEDVNKNVNKNLAFGVEKLATSADEFKSYNKKLLSSSEKIVNAVETLYQKIDSIEAPKNIISSKIDEIFKETEDSSKKLNSLSLNQIKSAEKIVQSSEALIKNIESLNSHVSLIKESSETTLNTLNGLGSFSQKVHELGGSLENFSDSFSDNLESLLSKQKDVTDGIANHANELEKQLTRSREYTEKTHESMASMVKTLDSKLQ